MSEVLCVEKNVFGDFLATKEFYKKGDLARNWACDVIGPTYELVNPGLHKRIFKVLDEMLNSLVISNLLMSYGTGLTGEEIEKVAADIANYRTNKILSGMPIEKDILPIEKDILPSKNETML